MCDEYNGWANWQTWNSYNWLTSDYDIYKRLTSPIVGTAIDPTEAMIKRIESQIEEWQWTAVKDDSGLMLDLLRESIHKIDLRELAMALLD